MSVVWAWLSLVFCLRISHNAGTKISARAGISSKDWTWKGSSSKLTWWLTELNSSREVGWTALTFLNFLSVELSNMTTYFIKLCKPTRQYRVYKQDVNTVLRNLNSVMTYHFFFLLIRNKPQVPPTSTQEKRILQRCECKEVGIIGNCPRSCLSWMYRQRLCRILVNFNNNNKNIYMT